MTNQYDIFDDLNSYLDKNDDCGVPEDDELGGSYVESENVVDISVPIRKKRGPKKKLSEEEAGIPAKKKSPSKKKSEETLSAWDSGEDNLDSVPSASSLSSAEAVRPAAIQAISLDDDLDEQMRDVQQQYNLIFNSNISSTPSDKRYFATLKKRYDALLKQKAAPPKRTSRSRGNTFGDNLQSLQEIFYNICVNYNLMAPVPTLPSSESSESTSRRRRSRRARQMEPELINLVDSPALILPGTINLDSDEEEVIVSGADKTANHSFDSENYEISLKVRWQGTLERFAHRKHQKFSELIDKLAKRAGANPSCVILDVNERIIEPNDTPDSIDYRISQFISGRVVEGKLADMFTGKQTAKPTKSASVITLKVQSDRFKQPLQVPIDKNHKMKIVVIKCAEELKCEPGQIKLSFDGETVEMDSTPLELELEGGEILDLRYVQ